VNEPTVRDEIRALGADAWVVIAFGQKLSRELLDGVFAINLHGSLLPAYRGAAPIQRSVMDGCAETGVSVISLAERMDAGLVYATASRAIGPSETSDEVHDRLAELGPAVIEDVLARHAAGTLVGAPQVETKATRARKLSKAEATIDFAEVDAATARAWRPATTAAGRASPRAKPSPARAGTPRARVRSTSCATWTRTATA
jgi:methionyl-tRNA formyltransferase